MSGEKILPLEAPIIDYGRWIERGQKSKLPVWKAWLELGEKASIHDIVKLAMQRDPSLSERTLLWGIQQFRDKGYWKKKRGQGFVLGDFVQSDLYRGLHIRVLKTTECTPLYAEGERPLFPPRVSFYGISEKEIDDTLREIVGEIEKGLDKLARWWLTRGPDRGTEPFPYLMASVGRFPPQHIPPS